MLVLFPYCVLTVEMTVLPLPSDRALCERPLAGNFFREVIVLPPGVLIDPQASQPLP